MKKTKEFFLYTSMWIVAVLVLIVLLWQNVGNARVINYSGIVRGATQKLVKEELSGYQDDALIARLDGIIYDLQSGEGEYGLSKNDDEDFQRQLAQLKLVWESIKGEIRQVRTGADSKTELYRLSQRHFDMADQMVLYAEQSTDAKLKSSILFYLFSLLISVATFAIINRRSRKALEKSIFTDNLTGILNREGFESAVGPLLRQQAGLDYVVVEFDIDNFKAINNTYGYEFGDRILCCVAEVLSAQLGGGQLCARIDADNFIILVRQSGANIGQLQTALNHRLREQMHWEAFDDIVFTVGAYQIQHNDEPVKNIMDKASTAHKTAKAAERAAVVWYDEALLKKLRLENELKNRMRLALTEESFEMYLQPKMFLNNMQVVSAEALVRWNLPDYGTVYPDSFIPLFEKNGLIAELDFYMLRKACAYLQGQAGQELPLLTISVNFSRVTLYHRDFYDTFIEIVDRYQIPHSCIEIEVTETAFNEVADSVIELLSRLKNSGFVISMDDFGAGYSSLNMLSKLPIQVIKLDREFLKQMQENENVKGVIAWSVGLAHVLGIEIVCEGVESPEQAEFLQKIGCDYGQGYYFSRPVPQEEFTVKYRQCEKQYV